MAHITVDVCTKNRYYQLAVTLMSVISQVRIPNKIIIYDDTKPPQDLRKFPVYQHIFDLMEVKKIEWEVIFGRNRGQHWGHQIAQDKAKELIWRIDDDEAAEPTVLQNLEKHINNSDVGAVAGLVIPPNAEIRDCPPNKISTVSEGNCQWFLWPDLIPKECEHLYSSYLYKKGIMNFDINLSPVAHREETLHTYGIFKKGYKLIVEPSAITYHFRSGQGGIRSSDNYREAAFYRDEIAFQEMLREYDGHKICYLDCGMGDHLVFKSVLPKIKEKYKDVTLAVCYPELFPGEKCISIAEGQQLCNPDRHNIFKWCIDNAWGGKEMKYAYAKMYGVEI